MAFGEAMPEPEPVPMSLPTPELEPEQITEPAATTVSLEPAPIPSNPISSPQPVAPNPAPPASQVVPLLSDAPKELILYQWGFPERIGENTIKIPLFFRDQETKEEYWSYITISLDNIFKRL